MSIDRASVAHTDELWAIDATWPVDIGFVSRSHCAGWQPPCFFAQPVKGLLRYIHDPLSRGAFAHGRQNRHRRRTELFVARRPKILISRLQPTLMLSRKSCRKYRNLALTRRRSGARKAPTGMATCKPTVANIHLQNSPVASRRSWLIAACCRQNYTGHPAWLQPKSRLPLQRLPRVRRRSH